MGFLMILNQPNIFYSSMCTYGH
uniref:Uncharacterized protein n=1 Tax=Anguilla anguilla TaxID=7936 RepID=A0A0E9XUY9_ANGAN